MEINTEEILNGIKQLALKDIKCVVDKGKIDPADYQNLDRAIDIVKDIETVGAMKQGGYFEDDYGVSGAMMPVYKMNSMSQQPNSMSINSFGRGRSATTGRYVSMDNDPVMGRLESMMNTAQTEQERRIIQRMMNEEMMGR